MLVHSDGTKTDKTTREDDGTRWWHYVVMLIGILAVLTLVAATVGIGVYDPDLLRDPVEGAVWWMLYGFGVMALALVINRHNLAEFELDWVRALATAAAVAFVLGYALGLGMVVFTGGYLFEAELLGGLTILGFMSLWMGFGIYFATKRSDQARLQQTA